MTIPAAVMVLIAVQSGDDVRRRSINMEAADGTTIPGVVEVAASVTTRGPAALLLHMCGIGRSDRHNYDSMAPLLLADGFTLLRYDHRGHGESDYEVPEGQQEWMRHLMEVYPSDASIAYEALIRESTVHPDSVFVFGSSCGSFSAVQLARSRPIVGLALFAGLPPLIDSLLVEKPELPVLAMSAEDDRSAQLRKHRAIAAVANVTVSTFETGGHGTRILDERPEVRRQVRDWVTRAMGNRLPGTTGYNEFHPSWSPDGRHIAFDSNRSGEGFDVYLLEVATSSVSMITGWEGDESHPSWSPDGTQLVFEAGEGDTRQIVVMDLANRSTRALTSGDGFKGVATFSPDGQTVAYMSSADGDWDVYVVDVGTTRIRRLTENEFTDIPVSWTPDGDTIALHSDRSGQNEIYLLTVSTGQVVQLTADDAGQSYLPSPGPGRGQLSFWSTRGGEADIYSMSYEGEDVRRLTHNLTGGGVPSWSPDGTRMTYFSGGPGTSRIWIMERDGRRKRQVTPR